MTEHVCEHARIASRHTEPCERFFEGQFDNHYFIGFFGDLASRADEVVKIAATTLLDVVGGGDSENMRRAKDGAGARTRFLGLSPLLLQILLTRSVDNFLTYLSELLALAYTTQPDMLRTNETIAYKDVLNFPTRADLVTYLAERKIHDLSYSSLRELSHKLDKQHGFPLFLEEAELHRAEVLNARRNLITHNRGIVNQKYKSLVPESELNIGNSLVLDLGTLDDVDFLAHIVVRLDNAAISKFGLPYVDSMCIDLAATSRSRE